MDNTNSMESLNVIRQFSEYLRETYNLPPHSPQLHEVRIIVREWCNYPENERTDKILERLVCKHVSGRKEMQLLEGLDMSDLQLLQQQIQLLLKSIKSS